MKTRVMVSVLILAVGLVVLIASERNPPGWWSDFLLNLGTTVLLVVPIYFASSLLEVRVKAVKEEAQAATAELRKEVEESKKETKATLDQIRASFAETKRAYDSELDFQIGEITSTPDVSLIASLLDKLIKNGVISKEGVRVKLGSPDLWVKVRPIGSGTLELVVSNKYSSTPIFTKYWRSNEPAILIFESMISELEKAGSYGPNGLDPETMFRELRALLEVARATRRQRAGDDPGPAKQLVAPQWILYDAGIGTTVGNSPYFVPYSRLHEQDWRQHVGTKTWVDFDSFDEAVTTAEYLGYGRRHGNSK